MVRWAAERDFVKQKPVADFFHYTNDIWLLALRYKFANLILARNYGHMGYDAVWFGKWVEPLRELAASIFMGER
jgi:hypothetical protein